MKFGTILIVSVFLFIAGCTASSERRKADSEIYLEIAKEYIEAGLYDKALSEAENALKAFPQNYSARYLKIDTLAKLGRFDEALVGTRV